MRTLSSLSLLAAAAALLLTGCASTPELPAADPAANPAAPDTAGTSSGADGDSGSDAGSAAAGAGAEALPGPVETYHAWLAASRQPDAARACELMTDELQASMLAGFAATLGTQFPDCETMITTTAAMYEATGASADVTVEVVSETASEATLFSTYVGTGKCGTIHLRATSSGWVLTEHSEECAR